MSELFPYQQKGVEWLSQDSRNRYIAWEPGLGKTAAAIAFADKIEADRVLVLPPSHGRENWRREVLKWQTRKRSTHVVKGRNETLGHSNPSVVIASYDAVSYPLSRICETLLRCEWDLLVLDEAHMLGNPSKRTRYVLNRNNGLYKRARRVLPLSGTPATKSASELYPIIAALWPEKVGTMTWNQWQDKYCRVQKRIFYTGGRPREVRQIQGTKPERIPELRALLKDCMAILKTDDVLKEIPPLRVSTYPLSPDDLVDVRDTLALSEAMADLYDALSDEKDTNLVNVLASSELAFATQRRIIGEAKAPIVADIVSEELRQNPARKIVLFAHHTSVLHILRAKLHTFGVAFVDGSVSLAAKQDAQDQFQTNPAIRVFIGQIIAASTNLTLTAAADVALVEASWKPGDNYQAIRRVRRIGQTRPVLARYFTLDGADDKITQVLMEREAELDDLFKSEERKNG